MDNGTKKVFDPLRKRYVALTPEEEVRQRCIRFLVADCGYKASRMKSEVGIRVNNLLRRLDIIYFDRQGKPLLLVECKAPSVAIGQEVFDQAARYNMALHVPYFIITNGRETYCALLQPEAQRYQFLEKIPLDEELYTS
jgi:hypothetical protein